MYWPLGKDAQESRPCTPSSSRREWKALINGLAFTQTPARFAQDFTRSKVELQRQLEFSRAPAWRVVRNLTECVASIGFIGPPEGWRIGQVERFNPDLCISLLCESDVLHQCEIAVANTERSVVRQCSRGRAVDILGRLGKGIHIEVLLDPLAGRPGCGGIADEVRPLVAGKKVWRVQLRNDRVARTEREDRTQFPASKQRVCNFVPAPPEGFSAANRQLVVEAQDKSLRNIKCGERPLMAQIRPVLQSGVAAQPVDIRSRRIGIADQLGNRIVRQYRQAVGEPFFIFELNRMVNRVSDVWWRGVSAHVIVVLRKGEVQAPSLYRR